ncbi:MULTISPECIES: ABC transporter permease [Pseudonocardia]|uniref:Glutathione transport system permease protein GsiD n=2 Tax=Pseudonocardia TaxID=1847 RepID=A0A1Y2MJ40_PSEAH|nr:MULTISPECIES: ABC transporter permease [Pseudonocardia]OSY34468.1 Glutathione transport system permease protein GsiD [Pseudonocardia autotrophica]TDN72641.1 peptide/nickel transport system permease protein [Pseudonocardia autotrophica]BBG03353.1 peptide ABC transporter permease [Pseudonocardia autotrophica]GEC29716.1 peptide ABC transporter permease [Pseudonocardia saturnea]
MTARRAVGLGVLVTLVVLALLPHGDPNEVAIARAYAPPGADHLLGTDQLGRDLAARMAVGLWRTLLVIALAGGIGLGLGVLLGLIAGYTGRVVGGAVMSLANTVLVIPTFIAALIVSAVFGFGPVSAGIALGVFGAGPFANQTCSLVRAVRTRESIDVERMMGTPATTILLRHVMPEVARPVLAYLGSTGAGAAVAYAGLAFIGLGVDTTVPDWGAMLYEYRVNLFSNPLLLLWPTLGILLVAICLNSVVDTGAGRR